MIQTLTEPQTETVQVLLARANECLAVQIKHTYSLKRVYLLESARDALFDAWRCSGSHGGPVLVLAALNEFAFRQLDVEAAECVDQARSICHEALGNRETLSDRKTVGNGSPQQTLSSRTT